MVLCKQCLLGAEKESSLWSVCTEYADGVGWGVWCTYPPPSTIISPTTAFLKVSLGLGDVCIMFRRGSISPAEGISHREMVVWKQTQYVKFILSPASKMNILDIKERMKPPSWVKKIIYHRENLRKVRFSVNLWVTWVEPYSRRRLPGNSNNAGFLVSKSQTKYGWSAHVL